MKIRLITVPLIVLILGLQACSNPEVKQIKYDRDFNDVIMDLSSLHDFESIGISTSAVSSSTEGGTEYSLEIELKNGTNLKNDKKKLEVLGKQAMAVLINSIENEAEFDKLKVTFNQEKSFAGIETSFTREFEFKIDEK